ncbi:MAG: ABC transporter permease subunit [Clostridia bacterium]|nr:ABC transporter permease subunit [Clostridia bacterium]
MISDELSAAMPKSIAVSELLKYDKKGKISIICKDKNSSLLYFFTGVVVCTVISFLFMDIDWIKLISRVPSIGDVFFKLMHFDFTKTDLIGRAFAETVSIALLSTIYSMILGLVFGMIAAENIFRIHILSVIVKSFFTFLRAVPTPVWVLLMLVCMGFGPSAGIAGLCVHTTAFFTKSFAQSFEDIPDETIEALEVTGADKITVFTNAVLPAALSQLIAWIGVRFEINFSECAILGMVGAGGIGFVISSNIQAYEYGAAGAAIICVFLFAFAIERLFVRIKGAIK